MKKVKLKKYTQNSFLVEKNSTKNSKHSEYEYGDFDALLLAFADRNDNNTVESIDRIFVISMEDWYKKKTSAC